MTRARNGGPGQRLHGSYRPAQRLARIAVAAIGALGAVQAMAGMTTSTERAVQELREHFTVDGKPVPPEVFGDLGDSDLADSGSIWVTVDVEAAIGSNRYADPMTVNASWITQVKASNKDGESKQTSYRFVGATENKLLVVISSYRGGGSGEFFTLHTLDAEVGHGFDDDGKRYDRLNVTGVRTIALGDRWSGTVTITGNTITVVTTGSLPIGEARIPTTRTIQAERP